MSIPQDDQENWHLFRSRIMISRKIDLLALAAFSISIATIVIQLSDFFSGPEVKLLPPDQVFILRDDTFADKTPRVRFGATLIYVNDGQKGYSGTVRRELVRFALSTRPYEHGWDGFVTFDTVSSGKLIAKNPDPAKPFTIDGGESKSHQTYFTPWPKHCSVPSNAPCDVLQNHAKWDDFIAELNRLIKAGQHQFAFTFVAELIDHKAVKSTCKIDLDDATVKAIEMFKGYSPTCFADEASP